MTSARICLATRALVAAAASAQGPRAPTSFNLRPARDVFDAIDEPQWLDRLRRLQPIRFCPIVPGEAALYPSCAVKG